MLFKREDGVWDLICNDCKTQLTEQITNPMPVDTNTVYWKAWKAGWTIMANADYCPGCSDVQK